MTVVAAPHVEAMRIGKARRITIGGLTRHENRGALIEMKPDDVERFERLTSRRSKWWCVAKAFFDDIAVDGGVVANDLRLLWMKREQIRGVGNGGLTRAHGPA